MSIKNKILKVLFAYAAISLGAGVAIADDGDPSWTIIGSPGDPWSPSDPTPWNPGIPNSPGQPHVPSSPPPPSLPRLHMGPTYDPFKQDSSGAALPGVHSDPVTADDIATAKGKAEEPVQVFNANPSRGLITEDNIEKNSFQVFFVDQTPGKPWSWSEDPSENQAPALPTNSTRAPIDTGMNGDGSAKGYGVNPTLAYQKGDLNPTFTSDAPAVSRGTGSSGESIFGDPGNAALTPDPAATPDQNSSGLPGVVNKSPYEDALDGPRTDNDIFESKLNNYVLDMTKRLDNSTGALAGDASSAQSDVDKSVGLLASGASSNQGMNDSLVPTVRDGAKSATPSSAPPTPSVDPALGTPANPDHVGNYNFKTPRDSAAGQQLEQAQNYRDAVAAEVQSQPDSNQPQRMALVKGADLSFAVADQYFTLGDEAQARAVIDTGLRCLDIALDFTPGVSFVKNAVTVMTGVNPITGDHVDNVTRAVIGATLFAPALISGGVNAAITIGTVYSKIVAEEAGPISDVARELATATGEADRALVRGGASATGDGKVTEDVVAKAAKDASNLGTQDVQAKTESAVDTAERVAGENAAVKKADVNPDDWKLPNGKVRYPTAEDGFPDGFKGDISSGAIPPGTRLSRYGDNFGTFVAPDGTPFSQRALPPGAENGPYKVWEVVEPINAQSGETAPWFGQPGGGKQYKLEQTIDALRLAGKIKEVSP